MPLAELVAQAEISLRSTYKWPARYRSAVATALVDRRTLDSQQQQQSMALRRAMHHAPHRQKPGFSAIDSCPLAQKSRAVSPQEPAI